MSMIEWFQKRKSILEKLEELENTSEHRWVKEQIYAMEHPKQRFTVKTVADMIVEHGIIRKIKESKEWIRK